MKRIVPTEDLHEKRLGGFLWVNQVSTQHVSIITIKNQNWWILSCDNQKILLKTLQTAGFKLKRYDARRNATGNMFLKQHSKTFCIKQINLKAKS